MKKRSTKMVAIALLYYATIGMLILALLGLDAFLNNSHHDWLGVAVLAAVVVTTVTVMWRAVVRHLEQY